MKIKSNLVYAIVVSTLCLSIIAFFAVRATIPHTPERKDAPTQGDFKQYEYEEIKETAHTIAVVKMKDALSAENSTVVKNENDAITDYYSTRNATVLKFIKNEKGYGEEISFLDSAAMTSDNYYLHDEHYDAPEKNEKYLVFLCESNISGKDFVISTNNGMFALKNLQKNLRRDILYATLIEFSSNTSTFDIKRLKPATGFTDFVSSDYTTILTDFGPVKVEYFYSEYDQTEHIWIGGREYTCSGKMFAR